MKTCHSCGSPTYRESAEAGINDFFHYDCCENRDCMWSIARNHYDYETGKIDLDGNRIIIRSYSGKPVTEKDYWPDPPYYDEARRAERDRVATSNFYE